MLSEVEKLTCDGWVCHFHSISSLSLESMVSVTLLLSISWDHDWMVSSAAVSVRTPVTSGYLLPQHWFLDHYAYSERLQLSVCVRLLAGLVEGGSALHSTAVPAEPSRRSSQYCSHSSSTFVLVIVSLVKEGLRESLSRYFESARCCCCCG
jgi:hypothetical protein